MTMRGWTGFPGLPRLLCSAGLSAALLAAGGCDVVTVQAAGVEEPSGELTAPARRISRPDRLRRIQIAPATTPASMWWRASGRGHGALNNTRNSESRRFRHTAHRANRQYHSHRVTADDPLCGTSASA
jgi:hypothetical protein